MGQTLTVEELLEEFALFDDWNDRFQYIIELGDSLAELPEEFRVDANLVQGCQSRVWLKERVRPGNPPVIEFAADSDSQIVKGLIAILVMLLSGRTAREILQTDIEGVFERLDLKRHLSRSRSNGLSSMIKRIRVLARQHA